MAPMQQRMLDILAEVQVGFSEPLEELVKKPLETAGSSRSRPSADGEGLNSSLGRALRLGRENVKAKEYQRLVTRLVGDPSSARKTSRNFRRRTGGPPRMQRSEVVKVQSRPEVMSPRSTTSVEEVAEMEKPIVVHRHYHHHYHHHYAVSELEEMGHLVGEESGIENAAPVTSGDLGDALRSEIEHHHRHHHVMEVEMGLRARQLLEDALEARARGSGPKPGSSDGTKPDPRLPHLC